MSSAADAASLGLDSVSQALSLAADRTADGAGDLNEGLLSLLPVYGLWLVAGLTFLSCLALPMPSSLALLAAGGFIASGDLGLTAVALAALAGAMLGDHAAYWLARSFGAPFLARLARGGRRQVLMDRAAAAIAQHGGKGIFFTRWLAAPLGPWVNLAAGLTRYPWPRFLLAELPGAAIWVGGYLALGYVFGDNIEAAEQLLGSAMGFVATAAVTLGLGLWLLAELRRQRRLPEDERTRLAAQVLDLSERGRARIRPRTPPPGDR